MKITDFTINASNERHQTPKLTKFQTNLENNYLNLTGQYLHRNKVQQFIYDQNYGKLWKKMDLY